MKDEIIWLPVPHCHTRPNDKWIECTMFVLDIQTGRTEENIIWLRYVVDLTILLDYYNCHDKYHKYSSKHTHA